MNDVVGWRALHGLASDIFAFQIKRTAVRNINFCTVINNNKKSCMQQGVRSFVANKS